MKTLLSILVFIGALLVAANIIDRIYDGTGPPASIFLVLGVLILVGVAHHHFLGED